MVRKAVYLVSYGAMKSTVRKGLRTCYDIGAAIQATVRG